MKGRSSAWPGCPAMARPICCCDLRAPPAAAKRGIEVTAPVALVAGDRQADGIFPNWSISQNIGIRSLARLRNGLLISPRREADLARYWQKRINIRTPNMDNNILSLSGGNQQKALFARALGSDAKIVLMDDPMRGVDIGTKLEVYDLIREEARGGRTFLWYTTEIEELDQLRPRLCLSEWPHRRQSGPQRIDGGQWSSSPRSATRPEMTATLAARQRADRRACRASRPRG